MDGWIKLHRQIVDWEWYHDSKMVHLFLHLVLMAQHKDTKFQGISIARGQLITGRKALSEQTGLTEQTIRTCLDKLKETKEVTSKSTNRFSVLTVCNYSLYNPTDEEINQQTNQQLTSKQPATNQQLTTCKNDKNDKKVKKTTIPPMNHPQNLAEMMDYCKTQLEWNISEASAKSIWQYYCPPGGDEIWRDKKNELVKDWHRRMVTCKKNDNGANNGTQRTQRTQNNRLHDPGQRPEVITDIDQMGIR